MKVWHSYGTEHSMNLVMIGRFKTEDAAEKIEKLIDDLKDKLRERLSVGQLDRRYNEEACRLLGELKCFSLSPAELEQFLYEMSLSREGHTVRIWTDESDVSAFIKLMVSGGAKVEVYSNHAHPENDEGVD